MLNGKELIMLIKDGVMYMSKCEWSDLAARNQIKETHEGEFVLYGGYAHKVQVTCENNVQFAYNLLAEHEKTFDSITSHEEYDAYFKTKHELAVNVWRVIAEETKGINPGLREEVERGRHDKWYLFDSTKCFVDKNWRIFPKGTRCTQCGEIHHLPTEKSYGCGLSMRIIPPAEDDIQYEWAVFDAKTESVIEFGAEDSHLEAFEMCEEVVEDLAGK